MHKQFTKIRSGKCLAVQEALHLFAAFLTQQFRLVFVLDTFSVDPDPIA